MPAHVPATHAFKAFDTVVTLQLWGESQGCAQAACAIEAFCAECETLFSRTLPSSDISRLNTSGGTWVSVDARTLELIELALGYCEASGGVFDITVGPAVAKWDFKAHVVPTRAALDAAVKHVGWRLVEIDKQQGRVRLGDALAQVDLGGIAKGWIADEVARLAMSPRFGITAVLANLGGNVVVGGEKPQGEPWCIGVRDPLDPSKNLVCVPLEAGSVVTSGTYERSFERDGVRYHHVLNPQTGWPVDTDLESATLICRRSLDAEGFSTTVLALGKVGGARFVRQRPEIEHACLIGRDREVLLL